MTLFTNIFFDDPALIDQTMVIRANITSGFYPKVGDLSNLHPNFARFGAKLDLLVNELNRKMNLKNDGFRVSEQHVFNYERDRSFNRQWNVSFYSKGQDRFMRIGRGFSWWANNNNEGLHTYCQL